MQKTYLSFSYVLLLSLNISLGTFLLGYFLTVYNPVQLELEYQYTWEDLDKQSLYEGLITAMIPLGAALGSLFSSYSFQRFGRKKSCYLMDFLCIIGSGLSLIRTLPLLLVGRLICGFTVGVNSILVGLYIREICPLELSDTFGSLASFTLNIGIMVSFLLGLNTLSKEELDRGVQHEWWRVMFGIPIVVCLFRSVSIRLFFNYDSPLYLVFNNDQDEAQRVLKKIYKSEYITEIYEKINLRVDTLKRRKQVGFFKEVLDRRYSLRLMIGLSLVFGNQFSGVNAISFYSKKLFLRIGWSENVANQLNLGLGGVNLLAGLIIAIPIRKLGVKHTYLLSLFLVVIMLGGVSLFTNIGADILSVAFTIGYNFSFNLGCGPIIFMIIPQILPEKLIGFVFIVMWFFAFLVGFFFPKMIDSDMGIDGGFLFFACCVLLVFLFNLCFLKETGGKTNAEISSVYAKLNEPCEELAERKSG